MHKITFLLSLTALFLTSCGLTGPAKVDLNDDTFCQLAHPIYLDPKDQLTPNTERGILSHDKTGRVKCGWSNAG